MRLVNDNKHQFLIFLFFVSFFCVGLFIFDDFGYSIDEMASRVTGLLSLDYALNYNLSLLHYSDRYYGPAFEMILVAIEFIFRLTDDLRAVFLMRHFVTFFSYFF